MTDCKIHNWKHQTYKLSNYAELAIGRLQMKTWLKQNSSGLKGKGEKYPIGEKKGKALETEKSDPWVLWNTSKLSGGLSTRVT